jgi:hypothetical protein
MECIKRATIVMAIGIACAIVFALQDLKIDVYSDSFRHGSSGVIFLYKTSTALKHHKSITDSECPKILTHQLGTAFRRSRNSLVPGRQLAAFGQTLLGSRTLLLPVDPAHKPSRLIALRHDPPSDL